MPKDLPLTIGAALPVERLAEFRDWLFEADRDLELQSFHFPGTIDGDWQALADEANRQLDGFKGRLGIHGPFWGFSIASMDAGVRAVVSERMLQGLDVCDAVGARQMVIHSPFTLWDTNNLPARVGALEGMIGDAEATLRPAIARAEAQGVVLVIENIQDVDPDLRNQLADALDSPSVQLSIDTGHAQIAHKTTGAPPVDYFVRAADRRLAHVHLQDVDGYADRHWAPGEGTIPWQGVFRALAALEVQPHLVMELRDAGGIPAAMRYLGGLGLVR